MTNVASPAPIESLVPADSPIAPLGNTPEARELVAALVEAGARRTEEAA